MGRDQRDPVVICISPGINGRWDVSDKGSDEPLASFDGKEDAYADAIELTKPEDGATVLAEDEDGFSPLPVPSEGGAPECDQRHGRTADGCAAPAPGRG